MSPPLPGDEPVVVSEGPGGPRLTLPRRTLPQALRSAGWLLLGVGFALLLHSGGFFFDKSGGGEALVELVIAVPGLAVGALLLLSRTIIDLPPGRLVIRDKVGPLVIRRTYALGDLGPLTLEVLPIGGGGAQPVPIGAPTPTEGVNILAAAVRGKGRRVLVFGYAESTLAQVACQVRIKAGWNKPEA